MAQAQSNLAFPVSPKTRRGLNCTLSYTTGSGTSAVKHAFRVRCVHLTQGFQMIATESASREYRVFYPHQVAPSQFGLVASLVGQDEKAALNSYLAAYAQAMLGATGPGNRILRMSVSVPSRNFSASGIPVQGWNWGSHVGVITFPHTLVFETATDDADTLVQTSGLSQASNLAAKVASGGTSAYFYPSGKPLSGSALPDTGIGSALDPVTAAINGVAIGTVSDGPANATIADMGE